MKTARQRLLEYLQTRKAASAAELSRALKMTAANVRHHLSILAGEGSVVALGFQPAKGRGRPAQIFALSEQASRHNLAGLADRLLQEALEELPEAERGAYLGRIARRLAGRSAKSNEVQDAEGSPASRRNPSQRLYTAIQDLNEMNYQARWEAHGEGPRVILGRCPYAAILPEHPELCQLDRSLLEEMLQAPVRQVARLAPDRQGLPHCIFVMEK